MVTYPCPYCPEVFSHSGTANRHMQWDHPEEVADAQKQEAAEREAAREQQAATHEANRFTSDGFLKSNRARRERPSLFPPQLSEAPGDALPPWDREAGL